MSAMEDEMMDLLCVSPLLWVLPGFLAVPMEFPLSVDGGMRVRVGPGEVAVAGQKASIAEAVVLEVEPPPWVVVKAERYDRLEDFNPKGPEYHKAAPLRGVRTQECSASDALDPESVRVKDGPGDDARIFTLGKDYDLERRWGALGRIEGGAIGRTEPVFVDYRYGLSRIDSVVVDAQGKVSLIKGTAHVNVPRPPEIPEGQCRVANLWIPGRTTALTKANVLPTLADSYPEKPKGSPTPAERLVPRAVAKLRSGEKLKVLAWGDSVTVGTFVPSPDTQRWQCQFVDRLRQTFPKANIELITVAWGGRNVRSFLQEPPGSQYNYQEQVLAKRPDLLVSEFVNDAYLTPPGVEELYSKLLADFQGIGAEWIILTPHYVRPDWMGLPSQRDCDQDPRPYVKGLREFAPKHKVALADAALRWGHLWREGMPYLTYMLNDINHPDERGMKLFADALMELFPEK